MTNKNAHIQFRVSAEEKAAFEADASRAGMRVSEYARQRALRGRKGRPAPAATVETLDPVLFAEWSAIGNNINQIARAMNRGRDPKAAEIMDQMQALWRVMLANEVTARRVRVAAEIIKAERQAPTP